MNRARARKLNTANKINNKAKKMYCRMVTSTLNRGIFKTSEFSSIANSIMYLIVRTIVRRIDSIHRND